MCGFETEKAVERFLSAKACYHNKETSSSLISLVNGKSDRWDIAACAADETKP